MYQTKQHYVPKYSNLHSRCCENLSIMDCVISAQSVILLCVSLCAMDAVVRNQLHLEVDVIKMCCTGNRFIASSGMWTIY
jgi:hypothetical protein